MSGLIKISRQGTLLLTVSSMDSERPNKRAPRFKVGDAVRIVGPDANRGQKGVVFQVSGHSGDFVHRYHVQFSDGSRGKYFGFELESDLAESA